ncbi:phosphatase PAP2 family protein [Desulfurobacterium sp. TC5-1]|uniref:phosphatase PAP2 family protein n=1 Tax=Desulfurobacterium sp. TC5-1 TaxID=1158318 RepID=UPI0003B65355|nr:phosphatase PAP2 family protein [Desulfurobacterium sp. TC5-1]
MILVSFIRKGSSVFVLSILLFFTIGMSTCFVDMLRDDWKGLDRKAKESLFFGVLFITTVWIYMAVKYYVSGYVQYSSLIPDIERSLFIRVKTIFSFLPAGFLSYVYENIWGKLHLLPPVLIALSVKNRKKFFFAFSFMYFAAAICHILLPTRSPVFCYPDLFKNLPDVTAKIHAESAVDTLFIIKHKTLPGFPTLADIAFPSLHVGYAFLLFLVSGKRIKPIAFVFYTLIVAGSIILGFHYVSDCVVGTLLAYTGWKLAEILSGKRIESSFMERWKGFRKVSD